MEPKKTYHCVYKIYERLDLTDLSLSVALLSSKTTVFAMWVSRCTGELPERRKTLFQFFLIFILHTISLKKGNNMGKFWQKRNGLLFSIHFSNAIFFLSENKNFIIISNEWMKHKITLKFYDWQLSKCIIFMAEQRKTNR